MNSRERLKALVEHKPVDRAGVAGWLHMPLVDRNIKDFARATISFTDYCGSDFIKIMSNGHYMAEAYGADIEFSKNPKYWFGNFRKYPILNPKDVENLPVLDPSQGVLHREVSLAKEIICHYKGEIPALATIFTPITWIQELSSTLNPTSTIELMKYHKKELHKGLEAMLETNLKFLDELIKVGIDGIFLANQFAMKDIITSEQYDEFCTPYDTAILDHIKDKTWFNMLHMHGNKNLWFEKCLNYNVQAFNWENCPAGVSEGEISSITEVRAVTDKIIIAGIDQNLDFYNANNDRNSIKDVLRKRLMVALEESNFNSFIFAPGCTLPLDVDRYVYTLMKEIVEEEGLLR